MSGRVRTRYFRTYGVAAGLGKRLTWPDPYFTFYAEASYERYSLNNWSGFVSYERQLEPHVAQTGSLRAIRSISRSIRAAVRSSPLRCRRRFPIRSGTARITAIRNMSDQDRYRWIEFHKWQFKAQWFQALSSNSNLVLMLKAEMGYLGSYNKNKVSPFNRYEVGGDGMSGYNIYGIDIIAMRGYEDGALDPSNYYSRGYNKYTAELRYPVILKPLVADLRPGIPRGR